jgi:acetylglutamate kinase
MVTKVYAATEAIEGGTGEVLIASGFKEGAIRSALEHENGTLIGK